MECGVSIEDCNFISLLQKQSLRFELRERNSRTKLLGSRFRTSKLVGWVEIPWKNLLASPTLAINSWFPLIGANIGGGSQTQPSLHLAISICKMHLSVCALQFLVESVSQTPLANRTVKEIYDPEDMSCVTEFRGNFVNMSRRIKRLDMEARQCRGNYSEVQYEDDSCFYSTVESTAPF